MRARRAAKRLGHRLCRRVALQLTHKKGGISLRQRVLKKATADSGEIFRAATYLLGQIIQDTDEVDELSLVLGGLRNPRHRQASLFFQRPSFSDTVANVEERFPGAIRRALVVNPDAPFPEDAVCFTPFLP